MGERIEIPLPDSEGHYIAWRDGAGIHIAPCPITGWQRWLGLVIVVGVGVLPLTFYVCFAAAFQLRGDGLPWPMHFLFVGFDGLLLYVISTQALAVTRFQGCALRRIDADAIELEIRQRGGRVRCYRIAEPVCLGVLFHHDGESALMSQKVTDEYGVTRREKYRDMVEVDLELRGASVTPRMALMSKKWAKPVPRFMAQYYKERNAEQNYAATVDASRPLADAVRECLGIPVEFRVVGGSFKKRMEV